ncbi:3-oxoacyl-[acyl-carrier-protein] synthase-3 [Ruminococcus sp. YE71]|uniref:beta-ketoacyl-ACP synthase III n=1 Tax=unclassified Ruminococcus TaxID=2608920 RepID=UPI0008855144|nr:MULTISPECIES: beta-ketoacyl-ACP synthase III [unclassified Ruminococcus]SDA17195.1 3-oxoacyl-[acyl-carrier-protein] synthase-3 [Ruminococcus sp. YE78]SFW26448.1 3-oxoacyl-[acyl-carrier-protein] synthase-3 [Ruminococcus sp. YE71]
MIKTTGVRIKGAGRFVPDLVATNDDFAKIVDTNDEWITQRTGIKTRHISNGEPTYYLGAMAAKAAVEDAGIGADEIGLILATTCTPDYFTPSTACLIQRELGVSGCPAIDLNCACSGFVYAVDMAKRYLACGDIKYVLVVAAEELSKFVDYEDRSTCILFGDAAAAVVLEKADDVLFSSFLAADGNGAHSLASRALHTINPFRQNETEFDMNMPEPHKHYLLQDGKEVYKFATNALPTAVAKACEKAELDPSELDAIIPHQANVRIIETAAKKLHVSMDKMVLNIADYGNTSSASIPNAFVDGVASGRIRRGDKVCFVGFGGGLTYGATILEY